MTTRAKIDNLLDKCSEMYLESIWDNVVNYHNYDDLVKHGYEIGETRYTLYHGGDIVAHIIDIRKDGEHIVYYDDFHKSFTLNVKWDKLFLTLADVKNEKVRIATNKLAEYIESAKL